MVKIKKYHPWNLTPTEAIKTQNELKNNIVLSDNFENIIFVAGVDVGFEKTNNMGRAAIAILELPELKLIDTAVAEMSLSFPYIPGLLSFREIPVILKAYKKLKTLPDLIICDGQGIAHPRRFGIACHLGLITNKPAIGAAKKRLVGIHDEIPATKGSWIHLIDKEEIIGAVLRSRENVKPIYISPGHKISLESSIKFVMKCITKYRLPETTRQAHNLSLFT